MVRRRRSRRSSGGSSRSTPRGYPGPSHRSRDRRKSYAECGLKTQNAATPTVNDPPDEESLHHNPLWSVTTLGSAWGLQAVPKFLAPYRQGPPPPRMPSSGLGCGADGLCCCSPRSALHEQTRLLGYRFLRRTRQRRPSWLTSCGDPECCPSRWRCSASRWWSLWLLAKGFRPSPILTRTPVHPTGGSDEASAPTG